jgi:replicative DNA helicase
MDVEYSLILHYTRPESMRYLVDQNVSDQLFYDPNHKVIFEFALEYYQKSRFTQSVTRDLLEDEFKTFFQKFNWPEEDYVVSVLVERLKQKYRRVQIQSTLREIGAKVMDDPEEALLDGLSQLSKLQLDTTSQERSFVFGKDFDQRLDEYFTKVLNKSHNIDDGQKRGVFLIDEEIDKFTFGIKPAELGVIIAAPNVGKSWVTSKAALEAALRGHRVYFASLENREELTRVRLECLLAGVPFTAYERGELTTSQIADLKSAQEKIREMGDRLIVDCPKYRRERTSYELYTRARFHGAELLVGDQLSWVTPKKNSGDKTQEASDNITDIADLTRETNIASLWAVQFNRQSMNVKKGRGGLHHIALSSTIEQTVDWAFSLFRSKEMTENDVTLFEILKSRRTEYKMWLLEWSLRKETKIKVSREYTE